MTTHPQRVIELIIAALVNTLHQGQSIVDEIIYVTVVGDDLVGELLQHSLIGQIALKVIIGQQVNDAYPGPFLLELFPDGFADPLGTAG